MTCIDTAWWCATLVVHQCIAARQHCGEVLVRLTCCTKHDKLLHWAVIGAHRRDSPPTDQEQPVARTCNTCARSP